MNEPKPWADEPTPLVDAEVRRRDDFALANFAPDQSYSSDPDADFARDLERRLRHAYALIGKLRADSDCGDFDENDLEQRLSEIEETLTP